MTVNGKCAKQTISSGKNMAARKWTLEQRVAQSVAIQTWKPWQHSTGAKSAAGKKTVSMNAYSGAKRPFLRLINSVYKAHINQIPEALTLAYWENANLEMDKLCRNDVSFFNKRSRAGE